MQDYLEFASSGSADAVMWGGVVDVSGAESLWVEQRRVHCVPAGAVSDDQPGLAAALHVVVEAV